MASHITPAQEWLREYSARLLSSFRSSAVVKHSTTKGEAREAQIVKVLRELLPTRCSVEEHVTIVDSGGGQAKSFDAALVDRADYPLLSGDPLSVMVESVLAAIEIKSSLDLSAVDELFAKARSLRALDFESPGTRGIRALAVAFAYDCRSPAVRFFDYSLRSWNAGRDGPSGICVLGQAYMGLVDEGANGEGPRPRDVPRNQSIPCLYRVGADALLIFIYFLTRWVTADTSAAGAYMLYSQPMFRQIVPFRFEAAFLDLVTEDDAARMTARKLFEAATLDDLPEIYKAAKLALGM